MSKTIFTRGVFFLFAILLSGCKIAGAPLSGGVQTAVLSPTGKLLRLPNQTVQVIESNGAAQWVVTDKNGLAHFALDGEQAEYAIIAGEGDSQWVSQGIAQIIMYVVYTYTDERLQAVEIRK